LPCFHPLTGWRSKTLSKNGKRSIVFDRSAGFVDRPVTVPCGQCIGCRLERSRQWAIRCVHEAQLHQKNCFITLTYNDEHLPANRSLDLRHFQLFMKRFRKVAAKHQAKLRFYHCGEYGEQFGRPHYHACIFGFDFPDKVRWMKNMSGDVLFRSPMLDELWSDERGPIGFASVGEVTFQSAAYVARYIMKKVTGDVADDYYAWQDEYGEVHWRKPEYTTMSRGKGIGADWLEKFKGDVYPDDFVVLKGRKMRPPRYYDSRFELAYPSDFKKVKRARRASLAKHASNNTPERLRVRERLQRVKLDKLKRTLK
jgi:hypothetical protein